MYATLVIELGISPKYFLEEMDIFEIQTLFKYAYLKHKEEWEQTRMLAYIQAQLKSKKKLKIDDLMTFPWDEKTTSNGVKKEITKEDMERLQERIKHIQHGRFSNKTITGQ